MKNTLAIIALGGAMVCSSSAQNLVAGWDFDNITSLTDATIDSNYSDLGDISDGVAANQYGTLDFTSLNSGGFSPDYSTQTGPSDLGNTNAGIDFTDARTGSFNPEGFIVLNGESAGKSFDFDLSLGTAYQDFQLTYAAGLFNPGDTASIQWSYSTGGGFTNWDSAQTVTNDGAGSEFSLSTLSISASDLTVRATLGAGIDGFQMDNVQFGGVVPEPSSFALIAGVLSIAFVGARRRK